MSRVAVLIPAAGAGERLGRGPKAFVTIGGESLLELAVRAATPGADEVIVAVPESHLDVARRLAPGAEVVAGGATRQATVGALLAATTSEVVLVHDAARPFLTPAVTGRVLEAVRRAGAATAALAPSDTVVRAADGRPLPREELRLVQTPQGFERALLLAAHARAAEEGHEATDDASLVRRLGRSVELVEGSPLLAKLTRPADLALFEALRAVWLAELERERTQAQGARPRGGG